MTFLLFIIRPGPQHFVIFINRTFRFGTFVYILNYQLDVGFLFLFIFFAIFKHFESLPFCLPGVRVIIVRMVPLGQISKNIIRINNNFL